MHRTLLALLLATSLGARGGEPPYGGPVIDMHLHAFATDELPPGAPTTSCITARRSSSR